ncbi:hypothetical protein FACS1894132_07500 [Clostridia bacterium]|nr:hypothetical protein FACS1894132_07500 [Clostridia bacterium]
MKMIFTDVDGVLTDGRVTLNINSEEKKTICYRDLDAIGVGRRSGYDFAFVTGENGDMVKILAKRFDVKKIYSGEKDKLAAMHKISKEYNLTLDEIIYIGDSDRDAPALDAVGLGIAPSDGTLTARTAANYVTETKGGYGVLLEVIDKLIAGKLKI